MTKRIKDLGEEWRAEGKSLHDYVAMRLLKQRTVLLGEEIHRRSAQKVIAQLIMLSEESAEDPIRMFINSPGGDVDAGFAIFDVMRSIPSSLTTICTGLAASAAVVVLIGAPKERRLSLPNSRFLVHQPSTGVRGDASDIQIEASEILKCRKKINELIAEETGQKVEKVENDTRRNYWMNADEALSYGLVGRILSSLKDV